MEYSENFQPASKEEFKKVVEYVIRYIQRPDNIIMSEIKKKNWVALPISAGIHFSQILAENLSAFCFQSNIKELYFIPTYQNLKYEYGGVNILKALPTAKNITEFSHQDSSFDMAVLDIELNFIILCSPDEFNIICSSIEDFEKISGFNYKEARDDFRSLCEDLVFLLPIYKKYYQQIQDE